MSSTKKKVSFWATKTEKVPVKVKFTTKDGQRITFSATKAVNKSVKVNFRAKKPK